MALNEVKFQTVGGGLGRKAAGEDHYSALVSTAAAPAGYGGNIKEFRDLAGVIAAGITAASATYGTLHYQAKEFFRIAPGSALFIQFGESNVVTDLLSVSGGSGKVRQIGVVFSVFADITSKFQAWSTALEAQFSAGVVIVAGYEAAAPLTLSSVADQGINTAPNVAVLLAGSGSGEAPALATAAGKTMIPAVGAVLGALAKANVHESIAWVEKFNLSNGLELETIKLADGTNNPTYATLDGLNSKRYLVFRKHIGVAGTYLNDSHTAIAQTNDYAYLESSRTMGKVKRLVRAALLPDLNSPLTVDAATGFLAPGTIKYFESKCERPLDQMQAAGEISGYGVYINPEQDVLATSELMIQIKVVPRGVARNITVSVGFSVTTSF